MDSPFYLLEEEDRQLLLTAYENKRRDYRLQLQQIEEELKKLEEKILQIKKPVNGAGKSGGIINVAPVKINPVPTYNPDWTWNEKIKYIFLKLNKAMTAGEIVGQIFSYQQDRSRTEIMRSISATLTVGVDKGLYTKEEREGENMLYRLVK